MILYPNIYIISISTNCIFLPFYLCDVAESAVSTPLSSTRTRFNRLARLNTDGSMNVSVTCPRPGGETPRGRLRTLSGPTSLWILSFMFGQVWITLLDILLTIQVLLCINLSSLYWPSEWLLRMLMHVKCRLMGLNVH